MIKINNKNWIELNNSDITLFLENNDESYFIEFKDDSVDNKKIAEEVCAFSNTFGGYIIIGVNDNKELIGCTKWNEEKIAAVIRDTVTPLPVFDIRRFEMGEIVLYLIRVEEGMDPPYITNSGKILERVSSSSCNITNSLRLNYLISKKKENDELLEKKIMIPEIQKDYDFLKGYFDIGFAPIFKNNSLIEQRFRNIKPEGLYEYLGMKSPNVSVTKMGDSIFVSLISLFSDTKYKKLPAHFNDFIEIMNDGAVRMRMVLVGDIENAEINMYADNQKLDLFKLAYGYMFIDLLEDEFVCAKKYERLKVCRQFYPSYYIDDFWGDDDEMNMIKGVETEIINQHTYQSGKDIYITDNRSPKTGFSCLDRNYFEYNNLQFDKFGILNELFLSKFSKLEYE